jgi:hypothetical protein
MSNVVFRSLTASERILVAIAVLVDGNDAATYLEYDEQRGPELRAAAQELARIELDTRLPYVGTMLRMALDELG